MTMAKGKSNGTTGKRSAGTKSRRRVRTRPIRGTSDWTCPMHGENVRIAPSFSRDEETGRTRKNGGSYFRCPEYSECGYYVSPGSATVPITDDEGRAIGRNARR